MGLKKYIGFSLLLIIVTGLFVFSIESGDYTVTVLDFSLMLPVVIWVLVPIFILFVATVLHLMFYGSLNYCKNRGFSKDESSILETIKNLLLQKKDNKSFKTQGYKNLSSILNQLNLDVKDDIFTSTDESLNRIVAQIKDIKSGKYVSDKNLKLNMDSDLYRKNILNKISEQPDYAVDVVKKADQFSENIVKAAFLNVIENKAMTTVKKLYTNIQLDNEMAYKLFLKDKENIEFGLTSEEIIKITKKLQYTNNDYLILAKIYKDALTPDKLIALFELLSEEVEDATEAYIYILLEYEMIEKVTELLSGYNDDDFVAFRALLELKRAGQHYSLDDFRNI